MKRYSHQRLALPKTRDPTRTATFQTVSPRTSVNKGIRERAGCSQIYGEEVALTVALAVALAVALQQALCLVIVVLWGVVAGRVFSGRVFSGRVFSGCVLSLGSARSVLSMMVVAEGTVRSACSVVGISEELPK